MSGRAKSSPWGAPKALSVLGAAVVATVVLSALISPAIVDALHVLGVADPALDEVTIRTLELVAIAMTAVALIVLGGNGKAAWGIPHASGLARRVCAGFAIGLLSLGVACGLLYVFQVRVIRYDLPTEGGYWLSVFARAMLSAVAVGLLEELWFRGGLFTLLRRGGGVALALVGGSVLYAAAHFLDIPGGLMSTDAQQWNGFQVLQAATLNIFRLQHLDSFIALFLAGLTLGLVRLRQGDVAMCIGIHAGWVLTIKVFKKLTYVSFEQTNRFLAGQYDDVIGWVAALCLAVSLGLCWRYMRPRHEAEQQA